MCPVCPLGLSQGRQGGVPVVSLGFSEAPQPTPLLLELCHQAEKFLYLGAAPTGVLTRLARGEIATEEAPPGCFPRNIPANLRHPSFRAPLEIPDRNQQSYSWHLLCVTRMRVLE